MGKGIVNVLEAVYNSPKKARCLRIIGTVSVYTVAAFFGVQLLIMLFAGELVDALIVALSAMVGFVAVGVARRLINAKRPYEVYGFYEVKPKNRCGCSFPSRHTYSAFVIATLSWVLSPIVTAALSLLALVIAVTRVLLGIHFVRDVACGALCGVIFGVLGIILTIFI